MTRIYFNADEMGHTDDVMGYALDYHLDLLLAEGRPHVRLYPATVVKGGNVFFCRSHYKVYDKGEGCGRQCDDYEPRNGKNGRCRFSTNCYDTDEEHPVLLLANGKLVPATTSNPQP